MFQISINRTDFISKHKLSPVKNKRIRGVILLWQREHLAKKMADYGNDTMFSFMCLSAAITPVSIRLKNTVRTSGNFEIIRRAEKHLLNERIRAINIITKISSWQRGTGIYQLVYVLDQDNSNEFQTLTFRDRKACHRHGRERRITQFNRL